MTALNHSRVCAVGPAHALRDPGADNTWPAVANRHPGGSFPGDPSPSLWSMMPVNRNRANAGNTQSGDEMDGYTVDSDGFHGIRQTWESLRAGLEQDRVEAERLVGVVAPGHEPASGFVARDQNDSGEALLASITQMQAFVDSYLNRLDDSEREYLAQEASGSQTFQSRGRST